MGLEVRLVVELAGALRLGAAGPLGRGGRPAQGGADLLGRDLHDGALVALGGLPAAGLELPDDDHPGTLGEALGEVLREVAPGVDPEERGLAVAPGGAVLDAGGDREAEAGDRGAVGGDAEFGVVGEVAGQGDVGVCHRVSPPRGSCRPGSSGPVVIWMWVMWAGSRRSW